MPNKQNLTERDICSQYINPALQQAGWDFATQVREEVSFTKGRVIVRGKLHGRGQQKRADYILYFAPNLPIAVIEAKDNTHVVGAGMQQALGYAESLAIPFAFSSNGDAFQMHDRTGQSTPIERQLTLANFPSPADLWQRYCCWKGIASPEKRATVETPYHDDGSGKTPRYYQVNAINSCIEAIARGQKRILLVMATGTGKSYTAFQIIWRLWKSRNKKRILFLADRNILVDQTRTNDFRPFGPAMTKIVNRQANKAFEIYLALYQAVTGNEEAQNIYRQFSPDFFDLVVIDECHRGSAAEDSAWREILDYFSHATHIGLTATPRETRDVSNIHYFGEPVYTYTLRQGIADGFLAPYKVVRIDIDKDLQGWRPNKDQTDRNGRLIADRIYNQKDFDRTLVLEKRTELVARKITEYLRAIDPWAKTIVFCEDIDHAERMRQALVNLNPERIAENRKYVMRITGDEQEGKAELDNFIDPESRYPVIATTGVDAQTCKLIVLDQRIQSMTEFKQIIGRGTRINEDYDKFWFTILDFKKASELFADPAFDGDPVQIFEPKEGELPVPPDPPDLPDLPGDEPPLPPPQPPLPPLPPDGEPRIKYVIGGEVTVYVVAERVQYYGPDGRLITESLKDYSRRAVRKEFASLDDFLRRWTTADKKQAVIDELEAQGVLLEALADEVGKKLGKDGKAFDPFDLVCHVAFDRPPLSRRERAEQISKRDVFARYGEQARAVLEALVEKYADTGIQDIENISVLTLDPFNKLGTPHELVGAFGGRPAYLQAVHDLEQQLYA
ncbi:MAG: DEAD/DEAH box helicase family protein [Rhodobacteraceae bacterium]|nr:DEAD/DEAH box helicase family protein [Paracoccaceae bacterium]